MRCLQTNPCINLLLKPIGPGEVNYTLNEKKLTERAEYLATLIQGLESPEEAERKSLFAVQELVDELAHPNSKLIERIRSNSM